MNYRIKLTVGDWSGDGHNRSENRYCDSNKPIYAVEEAYCKGSEILGFDLIKQCCRDYEDNKVPWDYLRAIGKIYPAFHEEWNLDAPLAAWDDEDYFSITSTDEWVDLILTVARIGDPDLEITEAPHEGSWHIGGYGIYY